MTEGTRRPRIGVYGGTFDPPHIGHLVVAEGLRHAMGLDRVLFVPAGRPPHKATVVVAGDADRWRMLELATAGNPGLELSRIDIERDGPSYTADLLARLGKELPAADLVFLMGEDSLRDFPGWHEPGRIAALAELGVATRPGVAVDLDAVGRRVPETRGRVHVIAVPAIGVSSREIRHRVASGTPITYLVPAAVERYIRERGLYRP